jgi:hypothetical protein
MSGSLRPREPKGRLCRLQHENRVRHWANPAGDWTQRARFADRVADARLVNIANDLIPLDVNAHIYDHTAGRNMLTANERADTRGNHKDLSGSCHGTHIGRL